MLFSVKQVVTRLGYSSPCELRNAIRKGIIKGVKIGTCVRISEEEVERVILEGVQFENSLGTEDIAELLNVSRSTVRRLIRAKKLHATRPRGHPRQQYVIQPCDFQYYLDHLDSAV